MKFIKGSEWRKWDLHVHTPFSFLNNHGFGLDFDKYVKQLFLKAIEKEIFAIGITDYFSIEGYKKIKNEYLSNPQKLATLFKDNEIQKINNIKIFPNIEFRLNKLIGETNRVNLHVIFSDEVAISDIEENFLHDLEFVAEGNPSEQDGKMKLKLNNIEALGKRLKNEHNNFQLQSDMFTGMMCAVVDDSDVTVELTNKKSLFEGKYLIFTPIDEDLSEISWNGQNHNVRKVLIQKSDGLFSANKKTINWGLGKTYQDKENYIKEFKSLKPCIWGSDAHDYEKLFEPDLNRYTWIKADLSFNGLKQIIYEPEERVYIGEAPDILGKVKNNKTKYIKSLEINQVQGYDESKNGIWFKNQFIEFNKELVAIIGNKGSGKSAIADILGIVGCTKNTEFSFLTNGRFHREKLSSNFIGKITWEDNVVEQANLGRSENSNAIEKVRFLPQNFFNNITNELEINQFERTLEGVIFNHIDETSKLGKSTFQELIKFKTDTIYDDIEFIKKDLRQRNSEIVILQKSMQDKELELLLKQIEERQRELNEQNSILNELIKNKPKDPNQDLASQKEKSEKYKQIELLNSELSKTDSDTLLFLEEKKELQIMNQEFLNLIASLRSILGVISNYKTQNLEKYNRFGFDLNKLIEISINEKPILEKIKMNDLRIIEIDLLFYGTEELIKIIDVPRREEIKKSSLAIKQIEILNKINALRKDLTISEKAIQIYQESVGKINKKISEINGSDDKHGTLAYLKKRLQYFTEIKKDETKTRAMLDLDELNKQRIRLSINIYKKKQEIINLYEEFKRPIDLKVGNFHDKLDSNTLINLEVRMNIKKSFPSEFMGFIDQGRKGSFFGKIPGAQVLKDLYVNTTFNDESKIEDLLNKIINYLNYDKRDGENNNSRVIFDQIDNIEGFYNYLFSLDYFTPTYELRAGNKTLQELSPGEKGILLLIFYLIIDEEGIPLIIDQPEDNLDNQSVFKMLSTFIKSAKKKRQIIIITHNPNLAVGADAEQIIYVSIDKQKGNIFSFESGSIENPTMNKYLVNILEGTMPAFDKRKVKYNS